jgi:hypothetical protein
MKSMNDRKMDMSAGWPGEEAAFPQSPMGKRLSRVDAVSPGSYPDTDEAIVSAQKMSTSKINKNRPKDSARY